MADLHALYEQTSQHYADAVHQIRDDQWHLPTPCTEWDVRALMQHLVNEQLWVPPLLEGQTIAQVGDRFDGDNLGDDPVGAWDGANEAARASVLGLDSFEKTTHLSFGDVPAEEYVTEMIFDLHIHGWDLRTGIGADTTMDDDVSKALWDWTERTMEAYRQGGVVGPAPKVPNDASLQTKMLALAGRRG